MRTPAPMPGKGTIQAKDPFASAPPGYGLTQDNARWPWGQPPRDVDPEVILEKALQGLERPKVKQEMMKLLVVGVSVEVLVEGYLFQAFQDGMFTPDVGLIIKPALALVIADMAEEEGIPYRLFENDDALEEGEMDDRTFFRMMKDNNPQMFAYVQENMNAEIRKGSRPRPAENFLNRKDDE
jgi:hypothetical protein